MTRTFARSGSLAVFCLLVVPTIALAQQGIATVTADAPIYIRAEVSPTPLRVAAPGTRLRLLHDSGDWLQVEFGDPQYGRRVGWTQRQFVTLGGENLTPIDLSVDPATPQQSLQPGRGVEPPPAAPTFSRAFPGTEMAYGWSFLRLSNSGEDVNSSLGWNVSVARNLTPWLGIVGDFGGHYYTELFGLEEIDVMQHTFMAGPRFAFRETALAVPYGHFLVGLARSDLRFLDFHESSHDLAIQPGGGIDIGSPNFAARFEVGWRKLFEDDAPTGFRMVVGAVVRSGATRTR